MTPIETPSERETVFSECRKYRYTLWREFYPVRATNPPLLPIEGNKAHNYLMVIGLNPSTADETKDDPTIRKCIGFAKLWGFGALCMTNLFAWRDTKPENMKKATNPIGEDNQHHLLKCASGAGWILAAWGKDGRFINQDLTVRQWLGDISRQLHCLRINKDGSPMHPLYVPYSTQPIIYP